MRRIFFLIGVLALTSFCAEAQEKKGSEQSGLPAVLEAVTGKKAPVFLQRIEGGKVVFCPRRSTREISVPASKIKRLDFIVKYDVGNMATNFACGKYEEIIAVLEPLLKPYLPYMGIDNNLREPFLGLVDAYRELGSFDKLAKMAVILQQTGDELLIQKALVDRALIAISNKDLEQAEKLRGELKSEAAKVYLKAAILRAQQKPKEAIRMVIKVIADYGNDMDWLPQSELLCAYLYLDLKLTNSAFMTARQVEHLYAGTHISADAAKFRASLKLEEEERVEEEVEAKVIEEVDAEATEEVDASEVVDTEDTASDEAESVEMDGTPSTNQVDGVDQADAENQESANGQEM